MVKSAQPERIGTFSALAITTGAAVFERWLTINSEGSTAITVRSLGSYEPVPAPMLITRLASPITELIASCHRGSGRRPIE